MFSDEHEERVFESTRIISEDEVPPDILEKIRQMEESRKSAVTKTVESSKTQNVGALMSAARLKLEKPPDAKLDERGTELAAKLLNAGKKSKEQRDERIKAKATSLADKFRRGAK